MITRALFPWLLGFIALGIAYPIVGDSVWLWAFVVPAVVAGYVAAFMEAA